MKKQLLSILLLLPLIWGSSLFAQNIINGDFEAGQTVTGYDQVYKASPWESGCSLNNTGSGYFQGTPDLYDGNCTSASMDLPAENKLNPRIAGTKRFVGMLGPYSEQQRRESIITTVDAPFESVSVYTLSFYVARTNEEYDQPFSIQMEALLRKTGSCVEEKLIPINYDIEIENWASGSNPNFATNNWTYVTADFFLSANEAAIGFDQIEIRPKFDGTSINEKVYVDDFRITWKPRSLANVVPVGSNGTVTKPSKYGPQEIVRFCAPDVFVDGSGSTNENAYHLALSTFNLNTWQDGTFYYPIAPNNGWISGQAPNNINVTALMGSVPWQIGQVYHLSFAVGPQWDSKDIFFVVENCCPESLELEVNCETNQIYVSTPLNGATGGLLWFLDGNLIASTSLYGSAPISTAGTYGVFASFTMPNGDHCSLGATIDYHEEQCCDVTGPFADAQFTSISGIETVNTIPWGPQDLPVICDENFRITTRGTRCEEGYYWTVDEFDPINWSVIPGGYHYNSGWILTPAPTLIDIYDPAYTTNTWYIFTFVVSANGQTSTKHIIFKVVDCARRVGQFSNEGLNIEGDLSMTSVPNPTTGSCNLNLNKACSGLLQIFSIDGKIIKTSDLIDTDRVSLDLADYPSGLYFARLTTQNGEIIMTKIIKE